jgi:cysteine sulfinate desulfinase/cysteine desulfurase-like protein
VLVAMGVPRSHLFGALRLTLGLENDPDNVERLLTAIPPLVAGARRAVA